METLSIIDLIEDIIDVIDDIYFNSQFRNLDRVFFFIFIFVFGI